MTVIGAHPQRLDLYVHSGDPVGIAIPVLDAAGAAQSLAGWSAAATVTDPGGSVLWNFAPTISSDLIHVAATPAQTATWAWSVYAARLVVTATPPTESPVPIALGWIRLYRP